MHGVTWHVREQTLQRVTQVLTFALPTVTSKRRRHHNHKIAKELDKPMLRQGSCRLCLQKQTSLIQEGSTLPNSCICHRGKDGCIVVRVHGFDIIRHVHSSRKDGSHTHESYAECKWDTVRTSPFAFLQNKVASSNSALTRFLTKPFRPLSLPVEFPASVPLQ